jgi:hypothetical protein
MAIEDVLTEHSSNGGDEDGVAADIVKDRIAELEKGRTPGFTSAGNKHELGVLQKVITAIEKEQDYRQLLMKADFLTTQEADKAANALAWAMRYGVSIRPVLDKIAARVSVNARRVEQVLDGLTAVRLQNNRNWGKGNNANAYGTAKSQAP